MTFESKSRAGAGEDESAKAVGVVGDAVSRAGSRSLPVVVGMTSDDKISRGRGPRRFLTRASRSQTNSAKAVELSAVSEDGEQSGVSSNLCNVARDLAVERAKA